MVTFPLGNLSRVFNACASQVCDQKEDQPFQSNANTVLFVANQYNSIVIQKSIAMK